MIELVKHGLLGLLGEQRHNDDGDAAAQERRQQLVDAEHAANRLDQVVPDENHRSTRDHTGNRARLVRATPVEAEQGQRTEARTEASPCIRHDLENDRVLFPCHENAEEQNRRQRVPIKLTKGGFKTRAEALAYCPILKAGGVVKQIQAPTLSHYWETYQIGAYKNLSKSKQAAYRIAWNRLKSLHDAHMDALTVHLVCQVVDDTCSTYYPARDCKSLLTTLFNLAAADGYCNKDIPSFITLPKLEETERTPFSDTEQAALWKLYESGDLRAAIPLLMIYTGMMPGEAMKLRAEHIHLDTRQIIGAGLKTAVRRKSPIVLADNILPLVQDLLDNAQPSGFIWKQAEHDWYADYYAALQAAGCRRLTPYSCRHTTATVLAISEGIAPQTVKKVMRWSTSKMLDRYAHPDHADAIDAVNTIQKKAT